jgi:hypothetical protein
LSAIKRKLGFFDLECYRLQGKYTQRFDTICKKHTYMLPIPFLKTNSRE